jgi:hypothetical protein
MDIGIPPHQMKKSLKTCEIAAANELKARFRSEYQSETLRFSLERNLKAGDEDKSS